MTITQGYQGYVIGFVSETQVKPYDRYHNMAIVHLDVKIMPSASHMCDCVYNIPGTNYLFHDGQDHDTCRLQIVQISPSHCKSNKTGFNFVPYIINYNMFLSFGRGPTGFLAMIRSNDTTFPLKCNYVQNIMSHFEVLYW